MSPTKPPSHTRATATSTEANQPVDMEEAGFKVLTPGQRSPQTYSICHGPDHSYICWRPATKRKGKSMPTALKCVVVFSYYTFLESAHINIINVQMMTDFLCKLKYTTKVASSIAQVDHHRPRFFLTLCSLTPASMLSAELQQSNFVSFFFGRAVNPKLIAEKRN